MHKVKVGAAIFRYTQPETGQRRFAYRGDEIEVNDKDFARLKNGGGLLVESKKADVTKETAPSPNTNNDPYDEMNVTKAVAFLDTLSEEERMPYFERERAKQRKGVLSHFDQPLWEGADS